MDISNTSAQQHVIEYLRSRASALYGQHRFNAVSLSVDEWKIDDRTTPSFYIEWPDDRPEAPMCTALDAELTVPDGWRPNDNLDAADHASGSSG